MKTEMTRRNFLIGAGALGGTLVLTGCRLQKKHESTAKLLERVQTKVQSIFYGDYTDVYRKKWMWDRITKGTHTRANCIAACSWNVFVKDGVVWREEQDAIYESPREDVPDLNPRGCQKGACYSDLMVSEARVLHPLKRVGERGEGKWKRVTWDQALEEIADQIIDAGVAQGSSSVIFDHGTTNGGYGPETAGEIRFSESVGATVIDSWSGVGDMPMGAVQTWGMYNCEGTAADWFRSDYIVIWVGNPVYTRIPEVHFMHEARYRGAQLIVVSPDLNPSTVHADLWLNIKPETDAALGLAAAQIIIENNLFNRDYVCEQTDMPILVREDTGRFLRESDLKKGGAENRLYFWDEAKNKLTVVPGCEGDGNGGLSLALKGIRPALEGKRVVKLFDGKEVEVRTVFERLKDKLWAEYTPEKAAEITTLSPKLIRRFAEGLAKANSAMIFASWGACKHHHSDLFQRAMILLMALTGNQGKSGGGMRVAAWWGIEGIDKLSGAGLNAMEILQVIPKAIRGLTPRDFEQIFTTVSEKTAYMPLMPFLFVHGGYGEMWSREDLQDPSLPHGIEHYMREAIDRGWSRMYPKEGRSPKVFIFTGSNPLRRWPAPQYALKGLWPKLDCVVSFNFRMSTSSMYADYFLPVAGYYEKHGIKYGQTYLPYIICTDQAVKPLGESKTDWEAFGLLTEQVSKRAKERGIKPIEGWDGKPLDLTKAYDTHTANGEFDPHDPNDPVKLIDMIMRSSPSLGSISGAEALKMGAVPLVAPPRPSPIYQTSSDFDPKDTHWPHRHMVEGKMSWPTLTGRQQFYIDHEWYLDAGESLPVHKDPPSVRSKYPLRINGGHARWSIHAIWRDHKMLLHLQRGQPVCFMNPKDCEPRGISDGDMVRAYNHGGGFEAMVKVAENTQPGEVIIYHAWEPYQFKDWHGQQEPVEAPWKAIHLAGGYGQLHYRMFYGSPGHSPRGAPVEVEKV